MIPQSPTAVSTERLNEILAGCDGVTPGPWRHHIPDPGYCDDYILTDNPALAPDDEYRFRNLVAETGIRHAPQSDGQHFTEDAKHIARLDPDTVKSLVSELLALRSPLQDSQEQDLDKYGLAEQMLRGLAEHMERDPVWKGEIDTLTDAADLLHGVYKGTAALSTPSPRIVGLEARNAELEGELDEAVSLVRSLSKSLTGLTPGGSEYHSHSQKLDLYFADTVACERVIRERFDSGHKARVDLVDAQRALSTAEARGLERAAAVLDERAGLALTRTMQRHIQADAAAIRAEARALSTNEATIAENATVQEQSHG